MQWIYAVQSHLLGFIERTEGKATKAQIDEIVNSQKRGLIAIEHYYDRAGTRPPGSSTSPG